VLSDAFKSSIQMAKPRGSCLKGDRRMSVVTEQCSETFFLPAAGAAVVGRALVHAVPRPCCGQRPEY